MNPRKFFITRLVTLAMIFTIGLGGVSINFSASAFAHALLEATTTSASRVPNYVNFQGVVRDADGKRLTGTYEMAFAIYDNPVNGIPLWTETQAGITARDGAFSVLLGITTAFPDNLFTSPNRYVGVSVNGIEMQPRQRFASVPYALHSADSVPVGTVIDWWRPKNSSTPLPDGYMVCNGDQVNDPESPLNGTFLPNLNGQFIYGTTNPNDIGVKGGAATHTHIVEVDPAPWTGKTTPAGRHNHAWGGFDGQSFFTFNQKGEQVGGIFWGDGMDSAGSGTYPAGLQNLPDANAGWGYTDMEPDHQHDVTVDLPKLTVTSALGSNLPPYTQLLKLCRVK